MNRPRAERPAMSEYGVDTPDWAALPWEWAAERLAANRNFWVATVSGAGRPHALPVWGVWDDDDLQLAFSCAPGSRKARNLAANPRAVVMVDDTVECISIEGAAAPVQPGDRAEQWIARYLAKYQPLEAALDADFLRQNTIYEFTPDRAFAVVEREDEFAARATRWVFPG
ncbi:MAG: pyridoxamine 5'-phosphate oxidase family protein [Acidimicrobiia bacterium]|jgi:pyridoxine/pyridoxamine 5'-phosphate oxidase